MTIQIKKLRTTEQNLVNRLTQVDWSFSARDRPHPIEGIHPYPAKFIGELPRALLNILPCPDGCSIFDPFAGGGTTLVEAQRAGLESIGIDLNPIACLISRVKTSVLPRDLISVGATITAAAREDCPRVKSDIPNLDHWFKPEVQAAVASILREINKLQEPSLLDALRLSMSSILVRVSNQDSDTRYAAVEKNIRPDAVYKLFSNAVTRTHKALSMRAWDLGPTRVLEADTLQVNPNIFSKPVGLVITSPPYPNAYEYWLYHKYRMWWLGFDPLAVKSNEIGARAHFFKKDAHTELTFWEQMRRTFDLINDVLIQSGHACFVIGRSKIRGKEIDNASIIESVATEIGFDLIARIERPISSTNKSFNLSHANIKSETIVILRKR